MLILKGENTGEVVGVYNNIGDARKVYSDASQFFKEKSRKDTALVLVEGKRIVMTITKPRNGL